MICVYKRNILAGCLICAATCVIFPINGARTVWAEEISKEDFYAGSGEQLVLSDDLYARVTVKSRDALIAEYALFRRDRTSSVLLLQRLPLFASGHAWLSISGNPVFYNPDCSCFEAFDMKTLPPEYFYLPELIPAVREKTTMPVRETLDEKTMLPLQAEYQASSSNSNIAVTYLSYGSYNNRYIPVEMLIRVSDREYEISLSEISFHPLSDAIFTRAFCEEISRQ